MELSLKESVERSPMEDVVTVQENDLSGLALPERERDRIDNEAVYDAWISLTGALPRFAEQRISRGEVFYSALDLAEAVIGSKNMAGWRIGFTTEGGPYSAALLLNDAGDGSPNEIVASHPNSLALAFISVIEKWAADGSNL
jgi:hypothetical protein